MNGVKRQCHWRQGDVLTPQAIELVGLHTQMADCSTAIVVTHDCDLAAASEKEPSVEIILAKPIDRLGGDSFGKTARRLHIEYQGPSGPVVFELLATAKRTVDKCVLFTVQPEPALTLDRRGRDILQHWLAARYRRSAFAEAFEARLNGASFSKKKTLLKEIQSVLDTGGEHIRALLFDVDDGDNIEREVPDDCYVLGIQVLYDHEGLETAYQAAHQAAEALSELFAHAFQQAGGSWQNIELLYCDAIADDAMTVAQQLRLRPWRLDHLSLADDPLQPMLNP
jgi:hypothetical protein